MLMYLTVSCCVFYIEFQMERQLNTFSFYTKFEFLYVQYMCIYSGLESKFFFFFCHYIESFDVHTVNVTVQSQCFDTTFI